MKKSEKKTLKDKLDQIHAMDDVKLLMTCIGIVRAEAIADFTMHPNRKELLEDLDLYIGSMVGRLDQRMVKKAFRRPKYVK